ncbi:alpha/beta hydrolase [Robertkochia solimangrovi]|uniref:alpha/beta hydrolase n=1 Tax=Robertkochia solimangrovi TaxID=2213046 RepID=UPI00117FFA7E|nr:alpha/beta hydrolase [Robertkochia solimangrovi]TRZ43659.1 alpha/beta hydrolase [Robertkochia solimangrovi]
MRKFQSLLLFILMLPLLSEAQSSASLSGIRPVTYIYKDTLKLDYYRVTDLDKSDPKPLILLMHGGGFAVGTRDGQKEVEFSKAMSMEGFNVASISYDLTMKGRSFSCDCPSEDKVNTFGHASRNIAQALDYLKEHSNDLGFDPDKIILAGSSAGAEGILNTAFMLNYPAYGHQIERPEGIVGVISLAGAILDVDYITEENAVPSYFVHGTNDKLVPYGSAPHHFCKTNAAGYLPLDGSSSMAKKLRELGVSSKLVSIPGGGHEWSGKGYDQTKEIAAFIRETMVGDKIVNEEVIMEK